MFGCRWRRRGASRARDSRRKRRPEGNLFPKGPQFSLADGRQSGVTAAYNTGSRCSRCSGSPARLGQTIGPRSAVPSRPTSSPHAKSAVPSSPNTKLNATIRRQRPQKKRPAGDPAGLLHTNITIGLAAGAAPQNGCIRHTVLITGQRSCINRSRTIPIIGYFARRIRVQKSGSCRHVCFCAHLFVLLLPKKQIE